MSLKVRESKIVQANHDTLEEHGIGKSMQKSEIEGIPSI